MEAVRALAEEIGPRPPGSKEEERAARWCAARLSEYGYAVDVESFPSRRAYQGWYALYFLIAAAGAMLVVPAPVAAMILGSAAVVLYARDADGRPLLRPRAVESRNVVARRPGAPKLVVTAHLDSARASLSFHPRVAASLRSFVVGLHTALLFVPVLAAIAWVAQVDSGLPGALWIASGAPAAYLLLAAALQVHTLLRMPLVPGANDNASGVEVMMRLARSGPDGVWFVATGSEESGMLGIQAFLDGHAHEVGTARFLNIDSVGAGEIVAAWEEGSVRAHEADPAMLAVAEAAGAAAASYRVLPTDATVVLTRRLKGLSLLAVDDRGVVPNRHWTTDITGAVDGVALDRAEAIARAVMTSVVAVGAEQ